MNRSLKLSMLVALALGSSQLMALDLGQVQVKSALGQPLLAEIPLHPDNPGELKGLTVQLASSEQFERAGIVGGRTKIPLHFSVANAGGAHPVIRITSSVPVDDPFLDLLIQVDGKAGKSVREYAILLDPPGASTPVATVARPAAPSKPEPAKAPVATRATPAAAPAPAPAAVSNGRYGPVQSGQTLSGIAHSVSPAGVDAQQMMLALQQANPDAFYKDNINALKSGAVLRVPTSAEAQAMTLAAAAAEVRRQNSDWRAGMPGKPALVADAAARGTSSGASGASSAGNEDRLALVPPKVGGGTSAQASGGSDKSAASLRDDLLRARENVASLQQQGNDLKARLKDLNEINSKNEHLLSLKNSEIAELQAKLAAARKAAGAPAAEQPGKTAGAEPAAPVEMEPAVATAGSSAEAETVPTTAATSAMATAASVAASGSSMAPAGSAALAAASSVAPAPQAVAPPAAKPVETKPASKPAPAPVKVAEAPWYMQTWAWAAGAAAIVLLLLLALLGRRRKPAAAKAGSSLADRFGSTAPSDGDLLDDEDTDQEQLLDQLAEHPDDIYLHLELVTLYYSRRDVERFEAAAEAMHAHITDPEQDEWQDVVHMGEDLAPEHPLFDHHEEAPASGSETGQSFDIDDYEDESDAPTVVSTLPPSLPAEPKRVSEYNFNFDLTHPSTTESDAPSSTLADDETVVTPHAEPTEPQAEPAAWDAHGHEDLPPESHDPIEFSDDPVDTKLDLARAYLDMGDADGARAMLGEVLKEGSQMQRDTARRLLDGLS
jgi:pilus assembly protein FimV